VLNTKPKDNQMFYGTAYASGMTTIKGTPNTLAFDISAKTGKNTKVFIPLNQGLSISDYTFITFADSASLKKEALSAEKKPVMVLDNNFGLDLNLDLEITPEAEIQIIFDSKIGDVMKGRGTGNLNINLNPRGDFKISGDYIIEQGDYLFTLGNVLNKSFQIENEGRITFNGDVENADIDIKAIYKLKASLYDLLQEEEYKDRVPVECELNLTGKLSNPVVAFNINLPTSDERTRTALKNAISTEEESSRQFAYLLIANRFYGNPTSGTTSPSTAIAGTSAMTTTFEMLSNQISNWFSQISKDFDIGLTYRPGSSAYDPQEVRVDLSTQLLNDKVTFNSNLDVRGNSNTTTNNAPITGDFDLEYKIPKTKISLKVFNRYNNPSTGRTEQYTQGIGIFFKHDFNKFSDLFVKKGKSDLKKEDEPTTKKTGDEPSKQK
jgi:hypothetical protein